MTLVSLPSLLQYGLFLLVLTALVWPVGMYLARVFDRQRTPLDPVLVPIERGFYRLAGIDPRHEMSWKQYAISYVLFGLVGTLFLYVLLRLQPLVHGFDPLFRPGALEPSLAMNTAISFATTTTWQAYGGETTMSYVAQVVGLASQNFGAGAAGLAVGIAFIRGFARERAATIGNFWVDLVRAILWVLLPAAIVGALLLVWQGVPSTFGAYQETRLLQPTQTSDGAVVSDQVLPMGPVAVLEFIKNLGTNGGGFFNVNEAHPFANPTPLTNVLKMLSIVVLPAALTATFGAMTGRKRDGWLLYAVMLLLFVVGLVVCGWAEQRGNPLVERLAVDAAQSAAQAGGNMEGKETRFGIAGSVLAAITTSNGATGSYNAMHDSFTPLGGMVPLINMMLGEVIFGGLGTGLYSMILLALIGLFVGGLMIGRTPEYLGKQIGPAELKLIGCYTVLAPAFVLLMTAIAIVTPGGLAGLTTNTGVHGYSEILYAYTSAMANNGQNFAGLSANSPFYNITTALTMIAGRYGLGVLALALAGRLAVQVRRPMSEGSLPTDTLLFAGLLVATVLIVGGLSYLPALAMGPIVEHLMLP